MARTYSYKLWSIITDNSGSYGLAFITTQKWKTKTYKLEKIDGRIKILQQLDPGKKDQKKPRYESKKMVLNQAQKIRLKNSSYVLEWL